jgi:hypothetical protein
MEEDTYESPRFVCCKNANMLVPVVRTNIEIIPPMPEAWSHSVKYMVEDVVESSMGVHNEITSNLQGSPIYYRRRR